MQPFSASNLIKTQQQQPWNFIKCRTPQIAHTTTQTQRQLSRKIVRYHQTISAKFSLCLLWKKSETAGLHSGFLLLWVIVSFVLLHITAESIRHEGRNILSFSKRVYYRRSNWLQTWHLREDTKQSKPFKPFASFMRLLSLMSLLLYIGSDTWLLFFSADAKAFSTESTLALLALAARGHVCCVSIPQGSYFPFATYIHTSLIHDLSECFVSNNATPEATGLKIRERSAVIHKLPLTNMDNYRN